MNTVQDSIDIDTAYTLEDEQIRFFQEHGYIKLKQVLSPEALRYYGEEITRKVHELNTNTIPMAERDTYQQAFIQIGNIWTKSEVAKTFVFGKRLGRIATELLGVKGVRIYHDQALYKEPSGGFTPWHADQFYWPLSTPLSVTAWIPLQETPLEMGPLAFASKSQNLDFGRDMEISDDSEALLQQELKKQNFQYIEEPFELGEVSFHYGWTYHRAGPNTTINPRKVMTVIYMDEEMRLATPRNSNQKTDRKSWCPDVEVDAIIDSPINPVIYSTQK